MIPRAKFYVFDLLPGLLTEFL